MTLNLGSITFGLGADTAGLRSALSALEGFGTRVDNAMRKAARGADYNTAALQRQEGAAVRALQQVQNMSARINSLSVSPQFKTDQIEKLERSYQDFVRMVSTPINRPLDPLSMQRGQLGFKEVLDDITRAMNKEASVSKTTSDAVAANFDRQRMSAMRAEFQVQDLIDKINRANASGVITPKVSNNLIASAQGALNTHLGTMNGAKTLDSEGFLRAQQSLRTSLNAVQRDLSATSRAANPLIGLFHGIGTAAELTTGPLNGFVFRLRAGTSILREYGLGIGLAVTALAGFTAGSVAAVTAVSHAVIEYQKAEIQLKALSNNSAVATMEMDYVREAANRAGLEFVTASTGFARFNAASSEAGLTATRIHGQFDKLSMLMGTLHLDKIDTGGVLRAFDQMYNKGKVTAEELNRQLSQYIPGAMGIAKKAAEEMGVSLQEGMRKGTLEPGKFIDAWLEAAAKMYHIDLARPIETFQAQITRAGNSFNYFLVQMDNTFQITQSLGQLLNQFTTTLTYFGQHMDQVAGSIGAVIGAMTGLLALAAVQGTFMAIAAGATAFATAMGGIKTMTDLVAASQLALGAIMTATPWGAIAMLVTRLGIALVGAKVGYDLFSSAARSNQDALNSNMGAVEDYINAQQRMKYNIASTTDAMIRQKEVEQGSAIDSLFEAQMKLADVQAKAARAATALSQGVPDEGGALGLRVMAGQYGKQVEEMQANVNKMQVVVVRRGALLQKLHDLGTLPEQPTTIAPPEPGKTPKTPDPDRGLRSLNEIIEKATDAQMLLNNMWRGPQDAGLISALDDVKSRLFNLNPDQLTRLSELLTGKGIDVAGMGGLKGALLVVTAQTNLARDAVREYNRVWQDIRQTTTEVQNLNAQLKFLQGGGNPDQMWFVTAMQQADEVLQGINNLSGPALRATLETIQKQAGLSAEAIDEIVGAAASDKTAAYSAVVKSLDAHMADLGISFEHTGDAAKDAKAGLTALFSSAEFGQAVLQETRNQVDAVNAAIRSMDWSRAAVGLQRAGAGLGAFAHLDNLQAATEQFRQLQQMANVDPTGRAQATIERINELLAAQGYTVGSITERWAAYLDQQQINTQAVQDHIQALEDQKQSWTDWATGSVDAIQNVLEGTQSLSDGLKSIFKNLASTVLDVTLFDPLRQTLTNSIRNIYSGIGKTSNNPMDVGVDTGLGAISSGIGNVFNSRGMEDANGALEGLRNSAMSATSALGNDLLGSTLKQVAGSMGVVTAQTSQVLAMNAATSALISFSASAYAAATAMATAGGGGILKDILGVGASLLPGANFVPAAIKTIPNLMPLTGLEIPMPRAAGGPMTAGQGYRVQEVGSGVEMFVPGVSGRMVPNSELTSSSRSIIIDASIGSIDARGATPDGIAALRQELVEREQRLRREIPYLIDGRVTSSRARGRY